MRYVTGAALLALAAYLCTGITQVRPGERAVVRRFGRVVAAPGPGLWVGFPWGVDRVDRIAVDQVRRVAVGYAPEEADDSLTTPAGQLLTGDHNLVNIQVVMHYAVEDDQVVDFLEHMDRADELVARAADTVLAEWVAGQGIDHVLIQGKRLLPGRLVAEAQARIGAYGLGIRILDADVSHLFPPAEVKDAFDEVTRVQTAISTGVYKARQEAAQMLRDAAAEQFRLEQQTQAYQFERLELARKEAERFETRMEQYHRLRRDNPAFLTGLWWDEIGKLFARMKDNGQLDLLDKHLAGDGLDITVIPPSPRK
jgi:membrane protease subunit HflK